MQQLHPLENMDSRNQVSTNFEWTNFTLDRDAKQALQALIVHFHNFLARHRFAIGINTGSKVQLTPLDGRPAYSRSVLAPNDLKDDILVELTLLHKCGIIATLPFSKSASPKFAQREPNGILCLIFDFQKKYSQSGRH